MAENLSHLLNEKIIKNNERINWDQYFMSIAILASVRSPCSRLNVGCVIVKNKRVISMGYNGFLPNATHNSIIVNNHEQATVHAEQNSISDAANRGVSVDGSIAYITHYPCINCFKILVASGINKIKYLKDYKNDHVINQIINDGANVEIEKIALY
tara:strand:- start:3884 stop:4351 length:468 start_codon:yes stop_codon:yes gene_type:complete